MVLICVCERYTDFIFSSILQGYIQGAFHLNYYKLLSLNVKINLTISTTENFYFFFAHIYSVDQYVTVWGATLSQYLLLIDWVFEDAISR